MSFRAFLEDELQQRQTRNPRYSLRAYARALSLDHASLSQILRGKRRLTPRKIRMLGTLLKLAPAEIDLHCAQENDRALLQLLQTPSFHADSRWIAAHLGIPLDEVNVALQRLIRTRTIVLTAPQTWEVL